MKARLLWVVALSALVSGVGGFVAEAQDAREETAAPSSDESDDDYEDDSSSDVVEEGDTKVKVFRFTGLDISGRLKSPQLLYFLNRLRAEFDRPKLPHRSFMPELVRSTKSKSM